MFLPEYSGKTSADSLLKVGKSYKIADFKYVTTNKLNTLAPILERPT